MAAAASLTPLAAIVADDRHYRNLLPDYECSISGPVTSLVNREGDRASSSSSGSSLRLHDKTTPPESDVLHVVPPRVIFPSEEYFLQAGISLKERVRSCFASAVPWDSYQFTGAFEVECIPCRRPFPASCAHFPRHLCHLNWLFHPHWCVSLHPTHPHTRS